MVGGDGLDFSREVATSTADTTTFNFFIKSTLSTKDAEMMMMEIKNYYLDTPLPTYEYMQLPIAIIPEKSSKDMTLKKRQ